jgi:murein DD-endopeptidase MepM/ murein hydrolase activator NlpD
MSMKNSSLNTRPRLLLAAIATAALACLLALAGVALGQDVYGQIDAKQAQLDEARGQKGVLTTEISSYSEQIHQLEQELSALRNREAQVVQQLQRIRKRLAEARRRLEVLRVRLRASVDLLAERLVSIYKATEPDALTVILNADGFDDLVQRYEYLQRIHDQDTVIVTRVRGLKAEQTDTVTTIEAAEAEVAAKRQELARTRSQLESKEADLVSARAGRAETLKQVEGNIERLEGDVSHLQSQVATQLQASSSSGVPAALPAGPIQGGSSGMIWPVNGPVTSGFGPRWGRMHEGIDIGVPAGTPIRAAKSGSVAIAGPMGGYGNYTCISHDGGLSTCYAHQSSIGVSVGQSVSQGETIGLIGCTGSCFGDHLHFEVRINGAATDPLGYL